jgi:hypothetical protein
MVVEGLAVVDGGVLGGFKWSSQHLDQEVTRGTRERLGCCGDGASGDAVAGASAGVAS